MLEKKMAAVYASGLIQGMTLVVFPAISMVLTNPDEFNFSTAAYGSLFIPQTVLAILASACWGSLNRHWSSKSIYMIGMSLNLLAMLCLMFSAFVMHEHVLSYSLLLVATGFLGLGFGLTVPTLNSMTALLKPHQVDSATLGLNAFLGVGTVLAPIFTALFIGIGFWWGLPLLLVILMIPLLFFTLPLALPGGNINISSQKTPKNVSMQFLVFATIALLYGIVETLNGNWLSIYMHKQGHASSAIQSLGLAAFWGMVTFGRVLFAIIKKNISESIVYRILPFIAAAALFLVACLPDSSPYLAVLAFGLAGFGCSALLPLTISFATSQSITGSIICFYLCGYGLAAFGVAPLQELTKVSLNAIYALGSILAIVLGCMTFAIHSSTREKKNELKG